MVYLCGERWAAIDRVTFMQYKHSVVYRRSSRRSDVIIDAITFVVCSDRYQKVIDNIILNIEKNVAIHLTRSVKAIL